jgi:hypothetical protein
VSLWRIRGRDLHRWCFGRRHRTQVGQSDIDPRHISLIISDEAISSETGSNTDFVVLMSGEPQGALIRRRHHKPDSFYRYTRPFGIFWRW